MGSSYAAPAKVRENWGPKTRVGGGLLGCVAATAYVLGFSLWSGLVRQLCMWVPKARMRLSPMVWVAHWLGRYWLGYAV